MGERMVRGDYAAGIEARLHHKDFGLVLEAGHRSAVPMPLAALAGGSAGSRVLDVMGERMVRGDYSAGIEARLHHKDFGLVLEAGHRSGVPMPLTALVGQQLNALMAQGWGRDDTASLLRVLER